MARAIWMVLGAGGEEGKENAEREMERREEVDGKGNTMQCRRYDICDDWSPFDDYLCYCVTILYMSQ